MLQAPTITASITIDVNASAEMLFETMIDINASSFVPSILSQEIVKVPETKGDDTNGPKVGMVLREVRLFGGKKATSYKTVTAVNTNPYSISAVIHKDLNSCGSAAEVLRTGSWTIHPIDDQSCCMVWTFAASAVGFSGWFSYCFCHKRILKQTDAYFRRQLKHYGVEAERRQRARLS